MGMNYGWLANISRMRLDLSPEAKKTAYACQLFGMHGTAQAKIFFSIRNYWPGS